jgi:AraC family transcriptional regulator, transcriptional activator FtrA
MAHTVAAVIADGANPFEFAVACEVFGIDRSELGVEWYDFRLCAPDRRVLASGGIEIRTGHDLSAVATADTVIVPQGSVRDEPHPDLLAALQAAHQRGGRLASFCTGAFTLAATGLLDGRHATTHWMHAEDFRRRFPRVRLDANVLFVDEGDILTSAGTAAGIDLALHMVRLDYGAGVARAVARRMVVPPHRDGGQAQFIDPPHEPRVAADGLAAVLDWLRGELHREVTVAEMAARAAMSERTFARRFKEETGTTPFRWLLAQRLQRAQELLETTDLDVDRVARRAGFGTAANLRDHFRRELATTPSAYRRTFQGAEPERAA